MCIPAVMPAIAAAGKAVATSLGIGAAGAGATAGTAAGLGTMGNIAVALQTVGGGLTALSQYQNAKAAETAARQNAAAQEAANIERIEAAERESDRQRRAGAIQTGRNRAAMAAGGIDPTTADPLSLLDEQQQLIEDDAFTIRENARRGAQAGAQQAANYRAEAETARSNAFFQPVATVLNTGAKVGSKYATWAANDRRGRQYG